MNTATDHDLLLVAWPRERLAEAALALSRRLRLGTSAPCTPTPEITGLSPEDAFVRICELMELEVEEVDSGVEELERTVSATAPGLVYMPGTGEEPGHVLVLMGRGRHKVTVLGPDLQRRRIPIRVVSRVLLRPLEETYEERISDLLESAAVPGPRRERARQALLKRLCPAARVPLGWLLRPAPASGFLDQLRRAGVLRSLGWFLVVHGLHFSVWLTSWWLLGRGALTGQFEEGWWVAWVLLLSSLVPLRLIELWLQGRISIDTGTLIRRRLLNGALRLSPDRTRGQGVGQLLGRVLESDAVESLVLSGGFSALLASVELLFAFWVLTQGAGGGLHGLVLLSTLIVVAVLVRNYVAHRGVWTRHRLRLTHDLVERMIGHRTRRVQEDPEEGHEEEDQLLSPYLGPSRAQDASATRLVLVGRVWLVAGFAALLPAFVEGATVGSLAVGLGGVLLTQRALDLLVVGLLQLGNAAVSWRRVRPIFDSAKRRTLPPRLSFSEKAPKAGRPVLEGLGLSYRYTSRREPALRGASVRLYAGDRVLVEGPSGGGKSTLAALLVGLREPDSGLLLLHGLDRETWGEAAWRRKVGAAPQFHENHVLTESFAFNVLMGREWPPQDTDLLEAEEVCRELGLGELLDRMPGGLVQMVGESGWQLSHGERSRLFIARALLQRADVVILDESFAALDSANLERAVECVKSRAPTLVVIAHP